jgi:hypothetical protein
MTDAPDLAAALKESLVTAREKRLSYDERSAATLAESLRTAMEKRRHERDEFGIECECPGPPLYGCSHWPQRLSERQEIRERTVWNPSDSHDEIQLALCGRCGVISGTFHQIMEHGTKPGDREQHLNCAVYFLPGLRCPQCFRITEANHECQP